MRNAGLEEAQAGIKIAGRNINNLRYAESEEELKSLLMKVKEEREKAGWKQWLTLFFRAPKSLQMVTAAMKLKDDGGAWWAAVSGVAQSRTRLK